MTDKEKEDIEFTVIELRLIGSVFSDKRNQTRINTSGYKILTRILSKVNKQIKGKWQHQKEISFGN